MQGSGEVRDMASIENEAMDEGVAGGKSQQDIEEAVSGFGDMQGKCLRTAVWRMEALGVIKRKRRNS
jgi:hypothetical protein